MDSYKLHSSLSSWTFSGEEIDIFLNGTVGGNIILPAAPFNSMAEWFFYGKDKDSNNGKALLYSDKENSDYNHNKNNTRLSLGANRSLVINNLHIEDEGWYLFEYDGSKRYIYLSLHNEEHGDITGNSTESPIAPSSATITIYSRWQIGTIIAVVCRVVIFCLVLGVIWLKKRRNLKKEENNEEEGEQNRMNVDIEAGNNNAPAEKDDITTLDICKMGDITSEDEDKAEFPLLERQIQDLKDSKMEAEDTELNIDQDNLAPGCRDGDQTSVEPINDNTQYSHNINNGDTYDIEHSPNIKNHSNISDDPGILHTMRDHIKPTICDAEGTKINAITCNMKEERIELMGRYPAKNEGNPAIDIPNRNLCSF